MARGISINVGLNRVDPLQYGSQFQPLRGCENDARDMNAIASSQNFDTKLILAKQATTGRVIAAIEDAAKSLDDGDMLLLTFSGHGSQQLDRDFDEPEGLDETLVLFDRNLLDDELYNLWGRFRSGVRILFISDSCHSGTQAQLAATVSMPTASAKKEDDGFFNDTRVEQDEEGRPRLRRAISAQAQQRHLSRFKKIYDKVRSELLSPSQIVIRASVIQIGACQDDELAADGSRNGKFTGCLRRVWNNGSFTGDHHSFVSDISGLLQTQHPKFLTVGLPNAQFESRRPFTI